MVAFASIAIADWQHDEQAIMGTSVSAEVWHQDDEIAVAAVCAVMAEMRRIDRLMSSYDAASELSRINRDAAARPIAVSGELISLIERALAFSQLTGGAFDVTYASAGYLYDYRAKVRPGEAALESALAGIDYRLVRVHAAELAISFDRDGVRIDLGGIAKGHAVDRALHILRDRGIAHAMVSVGGDTGLLGDRRGRPWVVGVRDPRDKDRLVAKLALANESISTSGDYERYFEEDGVRYHHILNPGTGDSAREVRSVTVLGPDVTTTDALSTSVFVMGVALGLELIESLPAIEAVIVDKDGKLHYSSGLRPPRP
ncbi:MAG: FAD:protein FMN transferase [Gammaproteobacteria bacterium]